MEFLFKNNSNNTKNCKNYNSFNKLNDKVSFHSSFFNKLSINYFKIKSKYFQNNNFKTSILEDEYNHNYNYKVNYNINMIGYILFVLYHLVNLSMYLIYLDELGNLDRIVIYFLSGYIVVNALVVFYIMYLYHCKTLLNLKDKKANSKHINKLNMLVYILFLIFILIYIVVSNLKRDTLASLDITIRFFPLGIIAAIFYSCLIENKLLNIIILSFTFILSIILANFFNSYVSLIRFNNSVLLIDDLALLTNKNISNYTDNNKYKVEEFIINIKDNYNVNISYYSPMRITLIIASLVLNILFYVRKSIDNYNRKKFINLKKVELLYEYYYEFINNIDFQIISFYNNKTIFTNDSFSFNSQLNNQINKVNKDRYNNNNNISNDNESNFDNIYLNELFFYINDKNFIKEKLNFLIKFLNLNFDIVNKLEDSSLKDILNILSTKSNNCSFSSTEITSKSNEETHILYNNNNCNNHNTEIFKNVENNNINNYTKKTINKQNELICYNKMFVNLGTFYTKNNKEYVQYYDVYLRKFKLFENYNKHNDFIIDIVIKEITKQLESERNTVENGLKNIIFSKMAHEFKTPLIIISSELSELPNDLNLFLEKNNELNNQNNNLSFNSSAVDLINKCDNLNYISKYCLLLIDDVIHYSSGNKEFIINIENSINITDLIEFCHKALISYKSYLPGNKKNIMCKYYIADIVGNYTVSSDLLRLKQIILNLLSNAVKFTRQGYININCNIINENQFKKAMSNNNTNSFNKTNFRKDSSKFVKDKNLLLTKDSCNYNNYNNMYLEILIEDTGIGFPSSDLRKIKNMFNENNIKKEGFIICNNIDDNKSNNNSYFNSSLDSSICSEYSSYNSLSKFNNNKDYSIDNLNNDNCKQNINSSNAIKINNYKNSYNFMGTGIGISIVNSIIEKLPYHYITIDSEVNKGTKCSIFIKTEKNNLNKNKELIHNNSLISISKKSYLELLTETNCLISNKRNLKKIVNFIPKTNFDYNLMRRKNNSAFNKILLKNKISKSFLYRNFNSCDYIKSKLKYKIKNDYTKNKTIDSTINDTTLLAKSNIFNYNLEYYKIINSNNSLSNNYKKSKFFNKEPNNIDSYIKLYKFKNLSIDYNINYTINHKLTLGENQTIYNFITNKNQNNEGNNNYPYIIIIDDSSQLRKSVKNLILKSKNIINKAIYKYNKDLNFDSELFNLLELSDGIDLLYTLKLMSYNKTFFETLNKVKFIFIDENMEFLNGSETIKIIKNLQKSNKLYTFKIISVTAFSDKGSCELIKSAGADYVINKPLSKINLEKCFLEIINSIN